MLWYRHSVQLSPEDIKELQGIWRQIFDETISDAEAQVCGNNLVELFLVLAEHNKRTSP